MIIVSSGSGTVTNINTTAPLSGGPITTSGTITTSMATNKLIGRSTAGTGAMEEITVGTGLSLTGGTLSSTGGGAAGSTNEIQFNNAAAFAASANLRWIIADNRLVLGTENTADTNSRMVVIGKGISTQNTFVVHNQTGTNNALVVRDDTRVGIATASPATTLSIGSVHNFGLTGSGGSAIFGSRLDQNSNTIWLNQNLTAGANAEALIAVRADGSLFTTLAQTSSTYTNNYNGSEGRSGVLYTKSNDTNAAKQKFAISNTSSAATNKFEWVSAVAGAGTLSNGFGTTAPIMTLVGNGNLLLGTTTDIASSILTINSTTKGVLLPRLTTTELNNIATPATGLTVYNTTENTLCFYNGTAWQKVNHSNL